jgi:hypothetical protein
LSGLLGAVKAAKKRRYEAMAKARWITGRVSVASLSPRLNGAMVSLRG